MDKRISDAAVRIRKAIGGCLAKEARPLTLDAIAAHPILVEAGVLDRQRISAELYKLGNLRSKARTFPMGRIRAAGPGKAKWEYYHKDYCNPFQVSSAVVNAVNAVPSDPEPDVPQSFNFNPIELDEPTDEVHVQAPPRAKSITLTIAGVTIRIEMEG